MNFNKIDSLTKMKKKIIQTKISKSFDFGKIIIHKIKFLLLNNLMLNLLYFQILYFTFNILQ